MLDGIKTYLEGKGISNIYIGIMPAKPDACVALFEYAGSPPPLHWAGEYPGLQVRTRSEPYDYPGGMATARAIMQALHGLHEQTLNGKRILLIKARGTPELLKRDESNRVEFVQNFDVIKEV